MKFVPLKHHRLSIRLRDFDYSKEGAYFVTIVLFQHECLLGNVVDGEIKLNRFGLIARDQWEKLPKRFP